MCRAGPEETHVPKIDAPTVAEHHRQRRAALLTAAGDLLADGGLEALTLGAVGSAAGLARSSVYQYFDSTAALIAALVEDLMPRALERLIAETAAAPDPRARVDAFVRSALRTSAEPTHRALSALAHAPLPPECSARVAELHADQQAPLRQALAELGVADPDLETGLVMGLVQAATRALLDGGSLEDVTTQTLSLLHGGLGALVPSGGGKA